VLGNSLEALQELRRDAAAMGADAVVFARLTKLNSSDARTGLCGLAIRLTPGGAAPPTAAAGR
jgi:uncharacterized protein YbjQ (UPF0145 family)